MNDTATLDPATQIDIDRNRGDFRYEEKHQFDAGTGLSHDTIDYIANVKSDVLLALWDTLAKHGVVIPTPGPARVIYELAQKLDASASSESKKPPFPP